MTLQGFLLAATIAVATLANHLSYGIADFHRFGQRALPRSMTLPTPLNNIPRGGMQLFVKTLTGKVSRIRGALDTSFTRLERIFIIIVTGNQLK
jgi:hypothetical protein